MRPGYFLVFFVELAISSGNCAFQPPIAEEIPRDTYAHGQKVTDEYAWLRDANWPEIKDPKILNHLKRENAYAEIFFMGLAGQYYAVMEELKSRVKTDGVTPYEERDNWLYYEKRIDGKQGSIYCRKYGNADAAEEVILDVNEVGYDAERRGHTRTNVMDQIVSPDHAYLAYAVNHGGDEKITIKIVDLKTKRQIGEIRDAAMPFVWHEKIPGILYLPVDEGVRRDKVLLHRLDRRGESDKFVFGITDTAYIVYPVKSSSRKYVFFYVHTPGSNEVYALDVSTNDGNFTPVLITKKSSDGVMYYVGHSGDKFYVKTNLGAANFKVISVNEYQPSPWNDGDDAYVEEGAGYLKDIEVTQKYLIMEYREGGKDVIRIKRFEDGFVKSVIFPDAAYSASCYTTNYKLNDVRIKYSSLRKPETIYRYDYDSDELTVLKAPVSILGFDSNDYGLEFFGVPSSQDGGQDDEVVSIPVTILYKKSLFERNGSNPAYMSVYGASGISYPLNFDSKVISLVDRGFVYVVAHVRGGGEGGTVWYESAKLLNKKRTFRDFIAVADALISGSYTTGGNIVASGCSAGGTVIAVAMNERPDLFKAVVTQAPFVDVLHTMLDERLFLAHTGVKEWGNPMADARYFHYIKSYSPYENVKHQRYPHILIFMGLSDVRVEYWQATKWVAKLRKLKTDDNYILIKVDKHAGHNTGYGGVNGYMKTTEELLFIYEIFGKQIVSRTTNSSIRKRRLL